MSMPRNDWWSNAISMVRNYPSRKCMCEDLQQSGVAGASTAPEMILREYEAVRMAIELTRKIPDGELHIKLIELMYWKSRKQNIRDIVYRLGISEATGKRWHGDFIRMVGRCVGYTR